MRDDENNKPKKEITLEEFVNQTSKDKIKVERKETKKVTIHKRENNSGMGEPAPYTISRQFNWGAFLFNWIWGIKYKRWSLLIIPILLFIPYGFLISIIASIWAGTKGNQWAWEEIEYKDEEDFHHAQKAWVKAGFIIGLICLLAVSPIIISKIKSLELQKDIDLGISYHKFLSTTELSIPRDVIIQTDSSDNNSDILTSDKFIIYWLRPSNERTLKALSFIQTQFNKNKDTLEDKFVLRPDIKTLSDEYSHIVRLELEPKCKNEVCINTWLYKKCNNGFCIINPKKQTYYKVRTKENIIPKALSLKKKWH